jgi:hypothetical protein
MKNKIFLIKYISLYTILFNLLYILNVYSSENTTNLIPSIEVIPSITHPTNIVIPRIRNNEQEPISTCSQVIFEAAIEQKLFSNIIEYAPGKRDIILYISHALATFKNAILANEEVYFKECPQLKEILFPPRNISPLKNINANNSPRTTPVHSRRSSGSLSSSPLFNKFSVDPDMPETPKDLILKTKTHKNLASFIIAHCMITVYPNILFTVYDNLKNEAYKAVKETANTLEKNNKLTESPKQTDSTSYTLLEEKYVTLQNNKIILETVIQNYKITIADLENKLAQKNSSINDENSSSDEQEKKINALTVQIHDLQIIIEANNTFIESCKKIANSDRENINLCRNQIKDHEKKIFLYKLCTGIGLTFNVFLCMFLLYQNKLLPQSI